MFHSYIAQQPDAVENLSVTPRSSSTLQASWQPPANYRHPITEYIISYILVEEDRCRRSSSFQRQSFGSVTDTSVTIGDLKSYSTYAIYVTARSRAGIGVETSRQGTTRTGGEILKFKTLTFEAIEALIRSDMTLSFITDG